MVDDSHLKPTLASILWICKLDSCLTGIGGGISTDKREARRLFGGGSWSKLMKQMYQMLCWARLIIEKTLLHHEHLREMLLYK